MRLWDSGLAFDWSNLNVILIYNCGTVYMKIYNFILNLRLVVRHRIIIINKLFIKRANSRNKDPGIFGGKSGINYSFWQYCPVDISTYEQFCELCDKWNLCKNIMLYFWSWSPGPKCLRESYWHADERPPAEIASLHQHTECVYLENPNIQHSPLLWKGAYTC